MKTQLKKVMDLARTETRLAVMATPIVFGAMLVPLMDQSERLNQKRVVGTEMTMMRVGKIMQALANDALVAGDMDEVERLLKLFIRDSSVDAVTLITPAGEQRVNIGNVSGMMRHERLGDLISVGAGSYTDGAHTFAVNPINIDGRFLGHVVLRSRASASVAGSMNVSGQSYLIALLAAVLAGLVTFVVARRLLESRSRAFDVLKTITPGKADKPLAQLALEEPEVAATLKDVLSGYDKTILNYRVQSIMDPTTQLATRAHFLKLVDARLKQFGERKVVLALIDINRFRRLNDTLGVAKADMVLGMVGKRLREHVQIADRTVRTAVFEKTPCHVGRLAADQFAIVIPMADEGVAERLMQVIATVFDQPFEIGGKSIDLTATLAAATAPVDARNAPDLVKQAETALAKAKEERTTDLYFYTQRLADDAAERMHLEEDIRRGIENREFVAVFQPKIRFETGEVIGAEALARWRRPDGSVVSPGRFIPIIEDLGLISSLGISILQDACVEAAKWNRGGEPVRVAVNVSPHQFEDPDFIPSIYEALEDSKLDPELLELEITESVAVENPDKVAKIMRPLRSRGVRLAIDDFGTGHSNFTTVTRLPFDVFKIDQQFVRALSSDSHAPAIIEMILAMAETLGQETVAEGVETEDQVDFLRRRACTIGQGYHFSPPLPAHEFQSFVNHWRLNAGRRFA